MDPKEQIKQLENVINQAQTEIHRIKEELGIGENATADPNKENEQPAAQKSGEPNQQDRIVEGHFDGQNMVANNKIYPVPANYASKSKIVEGDTLKLTITEDGSFIYKQIGPVERKKVIGTLKKCENEFCVETAEKTYRVLLASISYFKGEENDEVGLIIPKYQDSEWGAVEYIIKTEHAGPDASPNLEKVREFANENSVDEDEYALGFEIDSADDGRPTPPTDKSF